MARVADVTEVVEASAAQALVQEGEEPSVVGAQAAGPAVVTGGAIAGQTGRETGFAEWGVVIVVAVIAWACVVAQGAKVCGLAGLAVGSIATASSTSVCTGETSNIGSKTEIPNNTVTPISQSHIPEGNQHTRTGDTVPIASSARTGQARKVALNTGSRTGMIIPDNTGTGAPTVINPKISQITRSTVRITERSTRKAGDRTSRTRKRCPIVIEHQWPAHTRPSASVSDTVLAVVAGEAVGGGRTNASQASLVASPA